ncbi:MAG: cbb3-type cytochrome c oxidase subunit II [Verrucomicrobia bacterium]|nr:cbb3-type cytochrome c oxidase subunit II [Verrucomicrobiota bacterium]
MNRGPWFFAGVLLTFASSFGGLILAPQLQIGRQSVVPLEGLGQFYPPARPGQARQGAAVYQALGCVECHSQQVRSLGSDLQRGWGRRMSVARDYLRDHPVLTGNLRLGPDLANIGVRLPDARWHLLHLYDPSSVVNDSLMPRYPFLFDREPEHARFPSPHALAMPPADGAPQCRLVPKPEARALAAYLQSLRSDVPLFEAPILSSPAAPEAAAGIPGP